MTRTPFEESLSQRLSDLADDAPTEPSRTLEPQSAAPRHVQRRRLLPVAAALVVVAGLGIWKLTEGESSIEVITSPTSEQVPSGNGSSSPEAPDPAPPCGGPALGGVRTDARNWATTEDAASITITPTAPCELSEITVSISSGQSSPRVIDSTGPDPFPIRIEAGESITIEVDNVGGEACALEPYPGWGAGWLQIGLSDYRAESRQLYPTNPACEYSYSVVVGNVTVGAAYPSCQSIATLVNVGEGDYAGTRNTAFVNRGDEACRIDDVEVRGNTTEGESIDFTDYGDGATAGIPANVLPAVLGPGRGIVVLLVSQPTCLPPTTQIASTSVSVAGQSVELTTAPNDSDSCHGSYTVNLIEDAG